MGFLCVLKNSVNSPKENRRSRLILDRRFFQIVRLLSLSVIIYARRFAHAACRRLGSYTVSEAEL